MSKNICIFMIRFDNYEILIIFFNGFSPIQLWQQ